MTINGTILLMAIDGYFIDRYFIDRYWWLFKVKLS
jgi:hypothetical protein